MGAAERALAIAPLAADDNAGPPPAEFAAYRGRAAADAQRRPSASLASCAWDSSAAATARSSPISSRARRISRSAPALRRGAAGHGVAVHDHDGGLRAAGRSTGAGSHAGTGRASARHDAVGDQDPLDGRQLRAADPGVHARRRRLSRVPSRPADSASPCTVRERHTDHARTRPRRCSTRRSCSRDASTIIRTSASARRCCRSRPRLRGPAGSRCSSRSC